MVIDRMCRAAVVTALVLGLAGCGTIATNDNVEDEVKSQLGAEKADCPTDLEGEVGRSIVCKATAGDETYDVKVTVTSVDGDTVHYGIERVGSPAAPTAVQGSEQATDPAARVDGKNVAQSVLDQLSSTGKDVDEVTCPDLPARVGASERCTLVTGDETYGVTVTATSVQGNDVKFDIQVDQAPQ
jgi:sRNA-binding carbon storage regulator CsrA